MLDPTVIADIARRLFGAVPQVSPLWSNWGRVFLLSFDGVQPDRIFKGIGRDSGEEMLREQRVMRQLHAMGLAVPQIERTQDDDPSAGIGPFSILPRVATTDLGQFLAQRGHAAAPMVERAGRFIGRLMTLAPDAVEAALDARSRDNADWHDRLRDVTEHGLLTPQTQAVFDGVRERLDAGPDCFVHRDYHFGQVITDGSAFCVIDWNDAGPGYRFFDVGLCRAFSRYFLKLSSEALAPFLPGVHEVFPLDRDARRQITLWEQYILLWIAGSNAIRKPENTRRAMALFETAGEIEP